MFYVRFCLKTPYLIHVVDSQTLHTSRPSCTLEHLDSTSALCWEGGILNSEITTKKHKNVKSVAELKKTLFIVGELKQEGEHCLVGPQPLATQIFHCSTHLQ